MVAYVDKGSREGEWALFQHIQCWSSKGAEEAFQANDQFRKRRRMGVVLYHEVMSFSAKDSPCLTSDKMKDIAQKYISLRCPKAIVYSRPHFDGDGKQPHVHLLISGTEYQSSRTTRLSLNDFKKVRVEMEKWQKEKYPELRHSIAYEKIANRSRIMREKAKRNQNEQEVRKHKRTLDKDRLKAALLSALSRAKSLPDFEAMLQNSSLSLFYRRGKVAGIEYGREKKRKFRFATLGITKESLRSHGLFRSLTQGKER